MWASYGSFDISYLFKAESAVAPGHLVALPSFLLKSLWLQPPQLSRAASEQEPLWRLRDATVLVLLCPVHHRLAAVFC